MKMKNVVIFISVALVLLSCASTQGPRLREIHFTGKTISDENSGLTVVAGPVDIIGIIAVTNFYYHYSMILPYNGEWKFWSEDNFILLGNSGKTNVSLAVVNTQSSELEYLNELKSKFTENIPVPGIISAEIIDFKNTPILLTEIDPGLFTPIKGAQQVNYFSARKRNGDLYLLHLSEVIESKDKEAFKEFMGKLYMDFVTTGFGLDFDPR